MSDGYFVQNLSIRVGERQIVDDISFSLAPGEIVALAGASGAGKSMSAMTPFGLSAGKASGSAMLDGIELVGLSESELSKVRAEKVGFVFQQPLTALTPHRTVRQHLSEAAMQAGGAKPDKAAMVAMLKAVGLTRPDERLAQYPHRLSGGERQRVLIAAALAHNPRYLVADEPVSALDAALRGEIMALLVRLCRERGMAMLLVSHDLAGIEHHADRLLLLDQGRVIEAGSARQIATAPATDYGKRLMAATPRLSEPLAELPVTGEIILETEKVTVTFPKPGWQRGRIDAVVDADLDSGPRRNAGAGWRFGFGQIDAGAGNCRIGSDGIGHNPLAGRRTPPTQAPQCRASPPDPAGFSGPCCEPRSALERRGHHIGTGEVFGDCRVSVRSERICREAVARSRPSTRFCDPQTCLYLRGTGAARCYSPSAFG